jgi:hypothetical protein
MTNEEAAVLALKETLRYGMFLGTFAGTYVSVDECIAALWGRKRSVLSHPAAHPLIIVAREASTRGCGQLYRRFGCSKDGGRILC